MINSVSLRLSAQVALTTNVTPNLRAVCVTVEEAGAKYKEETIAGTFFFDGEISDDESDMVDIVVTEISCDFPWTKDNDYRDCDTVIHRIDYPHKMPLARELVYLRYEPGYEVYQSIQPREVFSEVSLVTVRIALQRALLGRITPNLRDVVVVKDDNHFIINRYYDKELTTLELMLGKLVEEDIQHDFSVLCEKDKVDIDTKIHIINYPNKKPPFESNVKVWSVYARYEL